MKLKLLLLFLLVFINTIVFNITETNKTQRINLALGLHLDELKTNYKTIKYHQKLIVENSIEYIKKNSIDLLDRLSDTSKNEKVLLRKELYFRLLQKYNEIKKEGVYQLQFTQTDNISFLRMHKPEKFDDDLSKVRYSIKYVNKTKKPVYGFEGGKTTHAIRYVHPIFNSLDEHIGAVEVSFSTNYIQTYLTKINNLHSHLLINKNVFSKEVWGADRLSNNYYPAPENNNYMLLLTDEQKKDMSEVDNQKILKKLKESIYQNMEKEKSFSIYTNHETREHNINTIFEKHIDVISFLPIKDTENKTAAWIVSYDTDDFIALTLEGIWQTRIISFFISIFLIYFIYYVIKQKDELAYKVEEKTKELNKYFDLIQDGIAIADVKTKKFVDCNKAFELLTGYKKEELIKFTIDKIHPKESLSYVVQEFEEQSKNEKDIALNIPILHKDTKTITLCDVNTGTYIKKGHLFNIGIFRVIEDRIKLENKLLNLNEDLEKKVEEQIEKLRQNDIIMLEQSKMVSMGEMLGNIAHQWRQPLNAISLAASGINLQYKLNTLDEENMNLLTTGIIDKTQYLSKTIDTFRNFIKEEKELKEVVIQEEIKRAIEIVESSLKNSFIKLEDKIDYKNPILITITSGELSQVLINILNNARDIILENKIENPWVKVELEKSNDTVVISIEDNAGGIPNDILPHIFEPYFTTKHKSQGTGLGLHISYKMITESLKGNITSINTKDGAKFTITLPVN